VLPCLLRRAADRAPTALRATSGGLLVLSLPVARVTAVLNVGVGSVMPRDANQCDPAR